MKAFVVSIIFLLATTTRIQKANGGVTNFELKQLQAQNEKLRETLVRMRDLSAHEKSESIKLQKEVEELRSRNGELSKSYDKCRSENDTLEAQISELQEQVDAALGAEEMVENLTTKCLDLEDKYNSILEEKTELEQLHEMDEELQENARELEIELREDIGQAHHMFSIFLSLRIYEFVLQFSLFLY